MVLDWKKVAVFCIIVAAFTGCAIAKILPDTVVIGGISAMLGWVGGLFTPTPKNKTLIVDQSDSVN